MAYGIPALCHNTGLLDQYSPSGQEYRAGVGPRPPLPGLDKMVITVITDHGKFKFLTESFT